MWQPSERYPDPAVEVIDPSFARYRLFHAAVERLATGCRWAEGPVWFGDARCLLWSDIPNNRILRWDEETGAVSAFRKPSNFANGNTRDRQGRLVTCEHGGRRVVRTEYDGSLTVLAERFEGKRLNSPNDVVVKSDGSIWFTDPPFGIGGNYEGSPAEPELPQNVYRIDGVSGEIAVVASDVKGPNGLAFSPDESLLYLVESRATPNRLIVAYDVADGRRLANRARPHRCGAGHARRLPLQRRRQSLVRLGARQRRPRRRHDLQPAGYAHRPHPPAGALRQRLLRRAEAQPPVHGGEPVGLCTLRQHARRAGRLVSRFQNSHDLDGGLGANFGIKATLEEIEF